MCQGNVLTIPKDEVGFTCHCSYKSGIIEIKSGKISVKYCSTSAFVLRFSNELLPHLGANNVQVKLPSILARAITINSPLGHICNAFLSNK